MTFWQHLNDAERSQAYNTRLSLPEPHDESYRAAIAGFEADARAGTERLAIEQTPYGSSARQQLHVFPKPSPEARTVVFIHGGYWQILDPSAFYGVGAALHDAGFHAVMPGYDLCPQVSLPEIGPQLISAVKKTAELFGGGLTVSGHSAGGHLAAWCLTDVTASRHIDRVVALSGVFEPEPLIGTWLNDRLNLTPEIAARASALRRPVDATATYCIAAYGDRESEQFRLQSEAMAAHWQAAGLSAKACRLADTDHYNVLERLPGMAN